MLAVEPRIDSVDLQSPRAPSEVLQGVNPTAVIDAIKDRAARWRAGRHASDGRRLGLVIEGGAMRGVCSAGGMVALAHLGLADVFDEIYATSAGAMNASYFLSGQASLGITIYYEDIVQGRIINPWRLWNVLDLDRIFHHVLAQQKVLRTEGIASSRTQLFVSLLDARTGELVLVDTRTDRTPLMTVLKASTAVPLAYHSAIEVCGRPCIDAGVANPFPMEEALASRCTDLLVLQTRPSGFREQRPSRAERLLFQLYARGNREVLRAYADQPARDARARGLAMGRVPLPRAVNIATVCPADDEVVGRLALDPVRLHGAAAGFGRRMLRAMDADVGGWSLAPPAANGRRV